MATLVSKEIRRRGFFGILIKWTFIAFNVVMLYWMIAAIGAVSDVETNSTAEQVGYAVGATIGFGMILGIWTMGSIILGILVLLTRGDRVFVHERTGSTLDNGPASSAASLKVDEMISRYAQHTQRDATVGSSAQPASSITIRSFGKRQ
jgi:hypothetical protein